MIFFPVLLYPLAVSNLTFYVLSRHNSLTPVCTQDGCACSKDSHCDLLELDPQISYRPLGGGLAYLRHSLPNLKKNLEISPRWR